MTRLSLLAALSISPIIVTTASADPLVVTNEGQGSSSRSGIYVNQGDISTSLNSQYNFQETVDDVDITAHANTMGNVAVGGHATGAIAAIGDISGAYYGNVAQAYAAAGLGITSGTARFSMAAIASKNASAWGGGVSVSGNSTSFGYKNVYGGTPSNLLFGAQVNLLYNGGSQPASTNAGNAVVFFTVFDAALGWAGTGDLDSNGAVDAFDLQGTSNAALYGETGGLALSSFDWNGDSTVDMDDRDYIVTDVIGTVHGDADLDGDVDFQDLISLSQHYNQHGMWTWGDFDGDWQIDFADYTILAQNYGYGVPSPLNFDADWAAYQAGAVPEPITFAGLVGLAAIGLRRARR